jgi:fumarate reductase subunit D
MRAANHIPTTARLVPLLVLLALMLFPFGWLGEQWPAFGRRLEQVFSTDARHAIGHAALFCLLGLATLIVLPRLHTRPMRYLGMLLLVGIGQEFFQMLYKSQLPLFDDSRDLLTDLAGMIVAFAVLWSWRRISSKTYRET